MLSKKILSILLAASTLAPATTTLVENIDPECVSAATEFVDTSSLTKPKTCSCLYAAPPYLSRLPGDINGDNRVNISDYTALKTYINETQKVTINRYNADLNKDGDIDFLDLLVLKTMI